MASYENLNVYKEVYNLSVCLFSDISRFDRNYKFTILDKVTNIVLENLELIILINNLNIDDRKDNFIKLEILLERLLILINITNDLKLFGNTKKFLNNLEILVKVKKMVKCWNK